MPELGKKPLGGTLIDGPQIDERVCPRLYLMDGDVDAVPGDADVGDERLITGKVRISELGKSKDGSRTANLEMLELYLEEKDKPTAAEKLYPSLLEG